MRKPQWDMDVFKKRREWLATKLKGSAMVIPAHPEYVRNHDVHHPYRQDSNFFYLTGFEEPESVMIFRPGCDPELTMFVRKRDPMMETWNGFRYGPEGVEKQFGVDKAHPIEDFEKIMPSLMAEVKEVYFRLNHNHEFDVTMLKILESTRRMQGRTGKGLLPILDPRKLLGEMRLRKSQTEINLMKKACAISSQAHIVAMKNTKPGVNERYIHGVLLGEFLKQGAARVGYEPIVATGANATTLHYVFNDQECKDGDLLLIDAGAEYQYYTGDITRTYPVNGKFNEVQANVYQKMLDVQKSLITEVKPGKNLRDLHWQCVESLSDMMLELGLLKNSRDEVLEKHKYKKYFPHGLGHWLGMDVHDMGLYEVDDKPQDLEPGMCFTVEPGIYIPFDDKDVPAEFRGIGIRIEDNICVTETGNDNMTELCPKEIADLEQLINN